MNRHLVSVEVGIEGCADQRMKLDRLSFNQHRFKGLDAEAVQRGCAIEQHRMFADYLFKDIPNLRLLFFDELLRLFDRRRETLRLQPRINERLKQLECHFLRQSTLMQFQLGTDNDHRTPGIVHAFAEQILAEAALLAFQHVGKRLQRTLVGARYDATAPAIVEQRIDGFLQHALFVAHDDVRCLQLHQALQTVVAVDHAAIQVVQIRRCKAAAIQRHQRTQFRRNHRNNRQNHPFRTIAGFDECLDDFQPLDQLFRFLSALRHSDFSAQVLAQPLKIDLLQQDADRFGADHGGEAVLAIFFLRLKIFFFGQELTWLQWRETGFENDVVLEIEHPLQILQRHVEHQTDTGRKRFQEPDMGDGRGELDMPHTVAPDLLDGDLDATFLADDALVLHPFVFAAKAFVVLYGAEDPGTEQSIPFWFEGPVIDGFRFLDLAMRPAKDLIRARK